MSALQFGSITIIVNGYTINNGLPYFQKAVPLALRSRCGKHPRLRWTILRREWLCRSEVSKAVGIHLAFFLVTSPLKQRFQHGYNFRGTELLRKVPPHDLSARHWVARFGCSIELGLVDVFVVGLEAFEVKFIRVIDAVDDVHPLRLVQINADYC